MNHVIKTLIIVILLVGSTICITSCRKKPTPPVVTTTNISDISQTSATTGGNVTSDGGEEIIIAGVCWSISANTSVKDKHTNDSKVVGSFSSNLTGLTPNTKYYVRAYAHNNTGTGYGNEISFTTSPLVGATLTTAAVTSITSSSAISGGNISSDGGTTITARGVCWGISTNPTIAGSHTTDGTGIGSFTSSLTGLIANTTYYVRAYATNSVGTEYGNEVTFATSAVYTNCGTVTDVDGNTYNSVTIGTQCWIQENLKTTRYRNGDPIPTTLSDVDWYSTTSGAYVIYNNDNTNDDIFGKLYSWYAVVDSRHLCPTDWHEPSDAEWTILETYLTNNGYGFGGGGNDIAKSMAATSGWHESSLAGSVGNDQTKNNSSGFAALPGGFLHYKGLFDYLGHIGFWWSSSEGESGSDNAWSRYLKYDSLYLNNTLYDKHKGLSVRCIKD
jgi:uncharacterized protein (TIGR02145 family)